MPAMYWVFAGLAVGCCLGVSVMLKVRAVQAKKRARHNVWRINEYFERAWELCVLADRITSTDAWRLHLVDPQRVIPGLLWSYVERAIQLQALEGDIAQASAHPNLAGLVYEKQPHASSTIAALEEIRSRLY
jgi:hypothetical protein